MFTTVKERKPDGSRFRLPAAPSPQPHAHGTARADNRCMEHRRGSNAAMVKRSRNDMTPFAYSSPSRFVCG
jgi:hypothetical protein